MNKRLNKSYSRKSNRLKGYDYSLCGYYYVTICTQNREEAFGIVENNLMIMNQYGEIVNNAWLEITEHFQNVKLDEFIIMPNHIHGIIIINNPVGTGHALSFINRNNDLSVIIGSFKSAVTKQINQLNNGSFKWQRSFYDHVVRMDNSLNKIRKYIRNNHLKWGDDENNLKNYGLKGQACLTPTVR